MSVAWEARHGVDPRGGLRMGKGSTEGRKFVCACFALVLLAVLLTVVGLLPVAALAPICTAAVGLAAIAPKVMR